MPDRDLQWWDEDYQRRLRHVPKTDKGVQEWIELVTPDLAALHQVLVDGAYGRRVREARSRLWARVAKIAVALTSVGAAVTASLHAAGVL